MGGFLRLEFRRNGGLLNLEFPEGTDECIPQKHLFYGLNQFTNNAQTDDTADDLGNWIQDKHPSISNTFKFICRRKPTKCGLYIKLQRP